MSDNPITCTETDSYLTRRELADLLKVRQVRTIDRYISQGLLPEPISLGQKRIWSRRAVEAKLLNNRREFLGGN